MGLAKQTVGELITVMSIIRTFHSLGCFDELRAKNKLNNAVELSAVSLKVTLRMTALPNEE